MDRRLLLVVIMLLAIAGGTVASAASLGLSTGRISAGSAAVTRCDTAVSASLSYAGASVSGVTISDLAAACGGGTLSATLTQNGAPLATLVPVTVPAGGGSVNLTVPAPQPAASAVTDVRVVVVVP